MKKILIIEDDPLITSLLEFRLKKDGYSLKIVEDGNLGVEAIENERFDLIVTDVMIPFKSGLEIINFAKSVHPETPIMVLSALGTEEKTVLEAFNLGVVDFVSKPFNPNELAIRVKRILH